MRMLALLLILAIVLVIFTIVLIRGKHASSQQQSHRTRPAKVLPSPPPPRGPSRLPPNLFNPQHKNSQPPTPNSRRQGLTPQMWAQVAKELLAQDRGLLQERDARGMSVLHVAAASGRCEDLVFLYAETGGEELIRRPDANGDDALALAPPNIRGPLPNSGSQIPNPESRIPSPESRIPSSFGRC
jgi:hypothetical protein